MTAAGTKKGPVVLNIPGSAGNVPFPDLESIAMSNDGETLYGVQYVSKKPENPDYPNGTHLWAYDVTTKQLTPQCLEKGKLHPFIHAEVEGLEMQANGLLLFAIYYQGDWGFGALDPQNCTIKATRVFKGSDYFYDLESIEWPTDECRGRSWLYEGSGDAIIDPLPNYEDVPESVVNAIEEALGKENGVEAFDGILNVFIGNQEYMVLPNLFDHLGTKRAGERSESENGGSNTHGNDCPISRTKLADDISELTYTDCTGDHQVEFIPVPVSRSALLDALSQFGQASIKDGIVTMIFADGTKMIAKLSSEIKTTGPLNLAAEITANIVALENGDFEIDYSVGQSQIMTLLHE